MMMSQMADALGATLHGTDVLMTGVSKDSRNIQAGDLYVALKGDRFDGHQFIAVAGSAGAAGMLVSDLQSEHDLQGVSQVQVSDTRLALGRLAAYWRQQWRQQKNTTVSGNEVAVRALIGITGSNGKTTVKEMCNKIFADFSGQSSVLATDGNLNNDIGMPMTLLRLREQHQYAVIEMGANHVGEIDYLSNIARPDVAIINNVGPAHLEGFGSLDNIAKAKAEIFNGLINVEAKNKTTKGKTTEGKTNGIAVFNRDDVFASYWDECCAGLKIVDFSMQDEHASVYAKAITDNRYLVTVGAEQAELVLNVPGKHNVMNALAATAASYALGLSLAGIVNSLATFENISGRLSVQLTAAGSQLIDDTYNANPLSVTAAIDVLADMPVKETILVLGDMAELGENAEKLHAEIGVKAKKAGVNFLYATGVYSAATAAAFGENGLHFDDKKALADYLNESLKGGEVILVKGSRSAVMEEVVERILTHNNNKRVN